MGDTIVNLWIVVVIIEGNMRTCSIVVLVGGIWSLLLEMECTNDCEFVTEILCASYIGGILHQNDCIFSDKERDFVSEFDIFNSMCSWSVLPTRI